MGVYINIFDCIICLMRFMVVFSQYGANFLLSVLFQCDSVLIDHCVS